MYCPWIIALSSLLIMFGIYHVLGILHEREAERRRKLRASIKQQTTGSKSWLQL